MKISEMFANSPYLCKEMFWDAPPFEATIDRVESGHEVPTPGSSKKDKKNVLFFVGTPKGLVLNARNTKFLIRVLGGRDTSAWKGKTITLFIDKSVRYAGVAVGGFRFAFGDQFSGDNPPPKRAAKGRAEPSDSTTNDVGGPPEEYAPE